MKTADSPREQTEAPNKKTPSRVQFTCGKTHPSYTEMRKDLLKASWNNGRKADCLYHFLYATSKEMDNQHIPTDVASFVLYETHSDILTKVKVSEPTLIAFLRDFEQAGYIQKVGHRGAYKVNLKAIQDAFTNPPDKPVHSKNFSQALAKDQEEKNETYLLRLEVAALRTQMQDFSLTLVSLKSDHAQLLDLIKSGFSQALAKVNDSQAAQEDALSLFSLTKALYLNESPEQASEADLDGQDDPLILLDNRDKDKKIEDREEDASASLTLPFTEEEIALIVRSRIPAGDAILLERLEHGSHRIYRKSGLPIGELIPVGVDVSEGLLALITVDSTAETTVDALPEEEISYSHGNTQQPVLEQNTQNTDVVPGAGYKTNTPSQQKETKRTRGKKAEQLGLPLQIDLGPLVMPDENASWNAGTALLVSEVLRKRRYTPQQRENQMKQSDRMFKQFPGLTRPQFVFAFVDWNAWWQPNRGKPLTIAELMATSPSSNEIRLQTSLDKWESRQEAPANTQTTTTMQNKPRAVSPNAAGVEVRVSEEKKQSNLERWKAIQAEKQAKLAEQAKQAM